MQLGGDRWKNELNFRRSSYHKMSVKSFFVAADKFRSFGRLRRVVVAVPVVAEDHHHDRDFVALL